MTPFQQRMIEDRAVRGLAPSTKQAYLRAVRELTAYYKRSPETLCYVDRDFGGVRATLSGGNPPGLKSHYTLYSVRRDTLSNCAPLLGISPVLPACGHERPVG
jgi:hypothetical protein